MYLDFYGFRSEPFHITPDPDFLYLSPSHKEALAAIIYGVQQRKGFITITGEIGLGKTTIVRSYLERYDRTRIKTVLVFNANVSFTGLLRVIYRELGLEPPDLDPYEMVHHLHTVLIKEYQDGWNVVLIIDEAQNMPIETLENLRMLSNLESTKDKLIQIILIGQPELENTLNLHQLRQLKQRIAIRTTLKPLTPKESLDYIRHRLSLVQSAPREVFTQGALELIIKEAQGIPRKINIICDNAFITGFGYGRKPVTPQIVREVIADLEGRTQAKPWGRRKIALAGLCAAVLAAALVWHPDAPRTAWTWVLEGVKRFQSLTAPAGVPQKGENATPGGAAGVDSNGQRIVKPLPLSEKGVGASPDGTTGDPSPEKKTRHETPDQTDVVKKKPDQSSALRQPAESRGVLTTHPGHPPLSPAFLERAASSDSLRNLGTASSMMLPGSWDPEKVRLAEYEALQKKVAAKASEKTASPDKKARGVPAAPPSKEPPERPRSPTSSLSKGAETSEAAPPTAATSEPAPVSEAASAKQPSGMPKASHPPSPEIPQPDPGRVIDWILNKRSQRP
uniref:Peptidoglycan-binding protein n=1 Tax=Desulfacinum infernum TaxID=35837 RepID=A0A832EKE7_9BACT